MKKGKKKNSKLSTIILVIILLVGLSLLLYPTFSDWWNSFHQSRAVASYVEEVEQMDPVDYDKIWEDAVSYNERLAERGTSFELTEEQLQDYQSQLDTGTTDVMGYVEIPSINCRLPIYHGTDEAVLQVAIGHLEWSSLPVGGESTHCVISGHRGLPSARLFTDLDQMKEGDIFQLHVLKEVLTYEVDKISVVEPRQLKSLKIKEGEDYCTLMTCTPYGVNSHRLLIRGHRIENPVNTQEVVTAGMILMEPLIVIPLLLIPILLIILLYLWRRQKKKS